MYCMPTGFHNLQGFDGLDGLHDRLRSPDAESLRSFTETIQDEYPEWVSKSGRSSRQVELEVMDSFKFANETELINYSTTSPNLPGKFKCH